MKRQEFLKSSKIKLTLISLQKKITQLHHRYVVEVVTDSRIDQIKKPYRDFRTFHKILRKKIGIKDKLLHLGTHFRSTNNYKDLQLYIQRLNSGYLVYKFNEEQQRKKSDPLTNQIKVEINKTKQIRSYLYDLLFREDTLYIEGADEEDTPDQQDMQKSKSQQLVYSRISQKEEELMNDKDEDKEKGKDKDKEKLKQKDKQKLKEKNQKQQKDSKNPFKKFFYNPNNDKNDQDNRQMKVRNDESSKVKKSFLSLAKFNKQVDLAENRLKLILKSIQNCWIKFPNRYKTRDRSKIYQAYCWQKYDISITDNIIELVNNSIQHPHRKIYVIFLCQVELNFDQFTKLTIKNKVDKTSFQIRLTLQQNAQEVTQQYLALYTHIKQIVKQQQQKNRTLGLKVCNKLRIRFHLKKKIQKDIPHQNRSKERQKESNPNLQQRETQLTVDLSHRTAKSFRSLHSDIEFKQLRRLPDKIKNLMIKIQHKSVSIVTFVGLENYLDVDFPVLDHFGKLDISVNQIPKEGFFPNLIPKDPLCIFNVPIQTIYDYVYKQRFVNKKLQQDMTTKLIQIKHTKASLTLDYKWVGNNYSFCAFQQQDIYQEEPPTEFNRYELRMTTNRLKRIVWSTQLFIQKIKDVKNFTYPNISYIVYFLLIVTCLFGQNFNLLSFILSMMILALIYNSPYYKIYLKDMVEVLQIKAEQMRLYNFLLKKNKYIAQELVLPNKKAMKLNFLQDFQLTRKIKRSIYGKYKRFFEVLLQVQILLTRLVSFLQKLKNLFVWYHYQKTKFFFLLIGGLLLALLFLPFRFIILAGVIKTMKKGSKFHQNVQDINRMMIIELLRIIIRQNNLNFIGVFLKQQHRTMDYLNIEIQQFYKLAENLLSQWLQVNINMEEIIKRSKNFHQLTINLSKCKTKYEMKKQICQKYGFTLEWSKTQSSAKKIARIIYGFIVSIPSDKYILGVQTEQANEEDEDQQEKDNTIDKQLFNF